MKCKLKSVKLKCPTETNQTNKWLPQWKNLQNAKNWANSNYNFMLKTEGNDEVDYRDLVEENNRVLKGEFAN